MHLKYFFTLYILFILLLVTLPINGTNSFLNDTFIIKIRLDYLGHAVLFFPFLFLFSWWYTLKILPALLPGILFAAFSEGLQYFLPYRAFNVNDLLANGLGVLLGALLLIPSVSSFLKRKFSTFLLGLED